jgi:hypothetical protein
MAALQAAEFYAGDMADETYEFNAAHGLALPPEDPVEAYEKWAESIAQARAAIEQMKAEGASEEEIEAYLQDLRAQTSAYLNGLDPELLQQIAATKGFEHPALVGLSGKGQHPLVHWLDPYYGDDIPSKQKIQAATCTSSRAPPCPPPGRPGRGRRRRSRSPRP